MKKDNNQKKKVVQHPSHNIHNVTLEELQQDFEQILKKYLSNTGKTTVRGTEITREFYRRNSKYTDRDWSKFFPTFKEFRRAMMAQFITDITLPSRDRISNRRIVVSKKIKRFVITAAVAGAPVHKRLLGSIQTYCTANNAELIILPMRGVYKSDDLYDTDLLPYLDKMYTHIQLNNELVATDFRINPKQINPLTTLPRYAKKHSSMIIASPKQQMITLPRLTEEIPRMLYSTGVITLPNYRDTRSDMIAYQDHVCGGLIVEILDNTTFYIRTFSCDSNGGFYDLKTYYTENGTKQDTILAFVMGDLHCGFEDRKIINIWKNCIQHLQPKYVVLHDIMDCASINKHETGNFHYNLSLPKHVDTLQKEMDIVGKTLYDLCKDFPEVTFVVTKGNHDMWLDNFLAYGKYATLDHKINHLFSLDLAKMLLQGKNPLKEYILSKYQIKNIIWLESNSSFKLKDIQLGVHGAFGSNGRKASFGMLETAYGPGIYGHTHTPGMLRDVVTVGTSSKLELFYNRKGSSSWLHASAILYKNGSKTLIIPRKSKWKL